MDKINERLILALDVDTEEEAIEIVTELSDLIGYFKIGMQLYYSCGNSLVEKIIDLGGNVFLDLKMHDIPNTVFNGARVVSKLGVKMTNFHASGGFEMMQMAAKGLSTPSDSSPPIGIAVTVLTSLNENDLTELGIKASVNDTVKKWALLTKRAGLKGIVCSPKEISLVKEACGEDFITVTPGIRPRWSTDDDQKRITTPYDAIKAGGDYLVIGRPIRAAENRRDATKKVLTEMQQGLDDYRKERGI